MQSQQNINYIFLGSQESMSPLQSAALPTSTLFSSIKRLMKTGYVIRTDVYNIEDPFFKRWIELNS